MGRSNLTFLSADGFEQLPAYQNALKKHNENMASISKLQDKELESIKGYSSADMTARNMIFAKYEPQYVAEKKRFDAEVYALKKSSNVDNILGGLNRSLDTTSSILSGFGIEAPSKETKGSPFRGEDTYQAEDESNKHLIYIIGGVVVLGALAFFVFKSKKNG